MAKPEPTPTVCPKCGSRRTRIVGQSGKPRLVYYGCEDYEHVPLGPSVPSGMDEELPKSVPTHAGDVLILWTDRSFTSYGVGLVTVDGQRDFQGRVNVVHVSNRAAAVAKAKALVQPGRRIFLRNIDSGTWSEISS
jgi:hypothetical protein